MTKFLKVGAVASAVALTLAACGGSSSSSSKGEISVKIGELTPLTGDFVSAGKKPNEAFTMALKDGKAKYKGRLKIEVKQFDQGATPQTAIAAYQKAKAWGADVTISIGGATPQGLAVAEAAKGTLQLGNFGTSLKTVNPTGFNQFALMADYQYPVGIELFYETVGKDLKSAAYVSADTYQVGTEAVAKWRTYLEGKGVKTTVTDQVAGTETNLTALAQKIVSSGASAVVADMPVPNTIALATALKRAGFKGIGFGGATQASGTLLENSPNLFDGYYAMTAWSPLQQDLTSVAQKFVKDYTAQYPDSGAADQYEAYAYDGLTQLLWAVDQAGSTDTDKVAENLRAEGPEGVGMEKITFGKDQFFKMPIKLIRIEDNVAQVVATDDQS
jgi:branched-chain amino acid transport system substrate-binding protein